VARQTTAARRSVSPRVLREKIIDVVLNEHLVDAVLDDVNENADAS
jgi:hypothetical protein